MPSIHLTDLEDPRLAPFRDLKNRPSSGFFVAEGPQLVERLLRSRHRIHTVLIGARHTARFATLDGAADQTLILDEPLLERLIGFPFHRGVLACGVRPARRPVRDVLQALTTTDLVVVCPEINDPENLGAILRNAAAFGASAVLLGERCTDPFSRRCLRVSVGTAFDLEILESIDLATDLAILREVTGAELVGAVAQADALPLTEFRRDGPLAILFGSEADGLHQKFATLCERCVTIPMAGPADSLNVAAASAVVLYATAGRRPS